MQTPQTTNIFCDHAVERGVHLRVSGLIPGSSHSPAEVSSGKKQTPLIAPDACACIVWMACDWKCAAYSCVVWTGERGLWSSPLRGR